MIMNTVRNMAALTAAAFVAVSCLFKNDMAYPHVPAEVLAFEVAGQTSVSIDVENRTVSVEISETAELSSLEVTRFDISEVAACENLHVGDVINLEEPMKIVLETYQQYEWTITATQPVDRYVKCRGQVGDAEFDLNERRVYVKVTKSESLQSIEFQDMKLEREGSVIKGYEDDEGNLVQFSEFPLTLNCVLWKTFYAEYAGAEYKWQIQVERVNVNLVFSSLNAWATRAYLTATFDGTGDPYFCYRQNGSEEWTEVRDVTIDGTAVSATVTGLQPGTLYDVRVINGEEATDGTFTTEEETQLHNMSFDNWYQDGKAWMPNLDASYHVWDSANPGSADFGFIPTTPTSDVAVSGEGKQAASLETQYAVIKLAAGNIYTGSFGDVIGVKGAYLDWGVEFSTRPVALTGYYKYTPVSIDRVQPPYETLKGQTDICQIQILLTDWDKPFTVNTVEGNFVDFDNDPAIIAYGKLESSRTMSEYEEFRINLEYRDLTRKPKYIVITACASKYGDYFTGGEGSKLLVDEFALVYDGEVAVRQ